LTSTSTWTLTLTAVVEVYVAVDVEPIVDLRGSAQLVGDLRLVGRHPLTPRHDRRIEVGPRARVLRPRPLRYGDQDLDARLGCRTDAGVRSADILSTRIRNAG